MEGYGNENPGAFQPTRPLRGATDCAVFAACTYLEDLEASNKGKGWYDDDEKGKEA